MIPLLLLILLPLVASSSVASTDDDNVGRWTVVDADGNTCIKMIAQIDLMLSYITDNNDAVANAPKITVPADATTTQSSCSVQMPIDKDGTVFVDSQVLQLDFPKNQGWNVRLAFTKDPRLDIDDGDYALYTVTVTANYSSMGDIFTHVLPNHIHVYHSIIDFNDPPEIATAESTRVGEALSCPSPQGYIINKDDSVGPSASITISGLLMQAYMSSDDFGKQNICSDDQTEIDLIPVVVSAVLAGLVLFTLVAYFVYRSRLPTDILEMTQPEFEEDDDHHHHNHKAEEHSNLNNHDNYGYKEDDHRF